MTTPEQSQNRDCLVRHATSFGLVAGFLGLVSTQNVADPDLFHEMALFREALAIGWIPKQDTFAYTPTINPIVHHEWGTGAVFYLMIVGTGLGSCGVLLLKYAGAIAIGMGCFAFAKHRNVSVPVFACLALVAASFGFIQLVSLRSQLFTLLFTLCLLHLLEEDRKGKRWWVLLWSPIYVVWLNMHGGVVVGVGLLGLYTIGRFGRELECGKSSWNAFWHIRHLTGTALAMLGLFAINPYGWDYAVYLWRAILLARPFVPEWLPVWHYPPLLALYLLSLLPIVYLFFKRNTSAWPELLMVLVPAWLAFQHTRHLSIYALVWICYMPPLMDETEFGDAVRRLWHNRRTFLTVFWTTVGILGVMQAVHGRFWELRVPTTQAEGGVLFYPVGVVDYMAVHRFTGNVMVPFVAGGFVSWKLHPAVKVSCDGRYEVAYPPEQVQKLVEFYVDQRDWQQTLLCYPPDAVMVPRPSPLEALIGKADTSADLSGWKLVYRDDGYSLYVRKGRDAELPVVDRSGEIIFAGFP